MSVLMRVMPQDEADKGFGLLKDIVALAKNPNAISEAHEKVRQEAALTENELTRLAEARKFMAEYEEKKKALEAQETALAEHRDLHTRAVEKATAEHTKKHNELQEWDAYLQGVAVEQQEVAKAQVLDRQKLNDEIAIAQAAQEKAMQEAAAELTRAKALAAENLKETQRLKEYKAKLDARAEKMKRVATED